MGKVVNDPNCAGCGYPKSLCKCPASHRIRRLLLGGLLIPGLALADTAATTTTLNPGRRVLVRCADAPPCPLEANEKNCMSFIPAPEPPTRPTCEGLYPVAVTPAATVLPQPPKLLSVDGGLAVAPAGASELHIVPAPAQSKKLKPWHKWAIGVGILVLGGVIEHQFDNDDGGGDDPNHGNHECPYHDCGDGDRHGGP